MIIRLSGNMPIITDFNFFRFLTAKTQCFLHIKCLFLIFAPIFWLFVVVVVTSINKEQHVSFLFRLFFLGEGKVVKGVGEVWR